MKAKVSTIQPISRSPAARSNSGTEYFQVAIFSLISERRSCRRVAMNSLISCFVSVKAAPSDFSVFTVSPPDAQSNSKHKSERAGNEHDLERIFTDRAIGAKPCAVVSGSDLRTHFADFFCCGVPQLVRAGGCCFSPLVRLGF